MNAPERRRSPQELPLQRRREKIGLTGVARAPYPFPLAVLLVGSLGLLPSWAVRCCCHGGGRAAVIASPSGPHSPASSVCSPARRRGGATASPTARAPAPRRPPRFACCKPRRSAPDSRQCAPACAPSP